MKKRPYLVPLFLFPVFLIHAQNVQFPPSVLPAGGGAFNSHTVHISKWRIGIVNVFYIESDDLKHAVSDDVVNKMDNTEITAYPNPATDFLKLRFDMASSENFDITLYDISGRKLIIHKSQKIQPGEIVRIEMAGLASALYLLKVSSGDKTINRTLKVSRQ